MDAKRALDVLGASALLVATAPLMAVAALAVAVESPGGVFFRQERVGRHGVPFKIHKFRTMRAGGSGSLVTVAGDSRITRTGSLLRASKIDELPQLFDVLVGNMSLVGPRPEVPGYVEQWPADLRETILSVRPGITDPMTVELRRESEVLAAQKEPDRYYVEMLLPAKARKYAEYVRTRSLLGDARILLATAQAVLSR